MPQHGERTFRLRSFPPLSPPIRRHSRPPAHFAPPSTTPPPLPRRLRPTPSLAPGLRRPAPRLPPRPRLPQRPASARPASPPALRPSTRLPPRPASWRPRLRSPLPADLGLALPQRRPPPRPAFRPPSTRPASARRSPPPPASRPRPPPPAPPRPASSLCTTDAQASSRRYGDLLVRYIVEDREADGSEERVDDGANHHLPEPHSRTRAFDGRLLRRCLHTLLASSQKGTEQRRSLFVKIVLRSVMRRHLLYISSISRSARSIMGFSTDEKILTMRVRPMVYCGLQGPSIFALGKV
nr:classical arabinogalactan protein 9-like [Lolium perenne]